MQEAATFIPEEAITMENGREAIKKHFDYLATCFTEGVPVSELVQHRTEFIDNLLRKIWKQFGLDTFSNLALIAVGGYGRGDLQPHSDIDILILSSDLLEDKIKEIIPTFSSLLWDLKLDLGQSVRTIAECLTEGRKDVTIATNLLETRLITGNSQTYDKLREAVNDPNFWPAKEFFQAKLDEQNGRHHYYKDTVYMLEPDIKNNPGGLRDIQTMLWVARKAYGVTSIRELMEKKLLNRIECYELTSCQDFLWRVRFALHLILTRPDNRLTFDRQRSIAINLGYAGDGNTPVETLMKRFYQTTHTVHELNEIFMQIMENNLFPEKIPPVVAMNQYFIFRGTLIDVQDRNIFIRKPEVILELFLTYTKHEELTGVYTECIRNLRIARRSLNHYLSELPECREIFREIIADPRSLIRAFPIMHKHQIFAMYIPRWNEILGLMQFDMFHQYTVDEHTLRVLESIYKFTHSTDEKYALYQQIYNSIDKPELLFIAALFHDIAKGRGGHHADLGAPDALYFCKLHGYNRYESRLVSWVVKKHLYMSIVAQRRDISDPDVVADFAKNVGDESYLNYLYCLTVADINATNDTEWNSYKDSLFRTLYFATRDALRKGLENPPDLRLHVRENQQRVLAILVKIGLSPLSVFRIWSNFKIDYFIRYLPEQIAWHTQNIIAHKWTDSPLILFAQNTKTGCTELFVYLKDTAGIFAKVCSILGSKKLNIMSATISNTNENYALDTFAFVKQDGHQLPVDRMGSIRKAILSALTSAEYTYPKMPEVPKQLKLFRVPTHVHFLPNNERKTSELEISTLDLPGILARISIIFQKHNLSLHAAKITTTGERVDDFFSLTKSDGSLISEKDKQLIEYDLVNELKL